MCIGLRLVGGFERGRYRVLMLIHLQLMLLKNAVVITSNKVFLEGPWGAGSPKWTDQGWT